MEESSATLDRIDLRMLRLLQRDGRISNAELADRVGVSAATCHRRNRRTAGTDLNFACVGAEFHQYMSDPQF